jgi:O-acetylhomoserine/O-acetylserine sulfhydrylase-like pyridoxal-dependent enzyme
MTTILHTLKVGDHILVCDDVHSDMRKYLAMGRGMVPEYLDMTDVKNVANALRTETKMVWI